MFGLPTPVIPQAPSVVGYLGEGAGSPKSPEDGSSPSIQTEETGLAEATSITDDSVPDAEHIPTEGATQRGLTFRAVWNMLIYLTKHVEEYVQVSDRLVNIVNKSAGEDAEWTVAMVADRILVVASNYPDNAEVMSHLCIRVAEHLSSDICDEEKRDRQGKPLSGGRLFRSRLLKCCQFAFETRLAALGLAELEYNPGADESEAAVQAENEKIRTMIEEEKSKGPGIVRFLGELAKIRFMSPPATHYCLQLLLDHDERLNAGTAEDACVLLTAVGRILDIPEAGKLMELYFSRLESMTKDPSCPERLQTMLKEIAELRSRGWVVPGERVTPNRGGASRGAHRTVYLSSKLVNQDYESLSWRRRVPPEDEQPQTPVTSASGERRMWANSRLRREKEPILTSETAVPK